MAAALLALAITPMLIVSGALAYDRYACPRGRRRTTIVDRPVPRLRLVGPPAGHSTLPAIACAVDGRGVPAT